MEDPFYIVNVDTAVVKDDEYLLIERGSDEEHASGLLTFPGGKVEVPPGEEGIIENTAIRELQEEVGIELTSVEYVTSGSFRADDGSDCMNIITFSDNFLGEPTRNAPEEVAAIHWLSVAEIQQRDDVPEFMEHYVEKVEKVRD